MTRLNLTMKAAAIVGALSLTAIAAPTALAADSGAYSKASSRVVSKVKTQPQDRGTRTNRSVRNDRGTRTNRNVRNDRGTRENSRDRTDRGVRTERSRTNNSRQRNSVSLRNTRNVRSNSRNNFRRASNVNRTASLGNFRRGNGYRQNGYSSSYRSGLGINFSFGSPGYSSYRWAPSNYGFYRPGRVSYASYRNQTRCDRVTIDGYQYGTLRPVSVTQCYNPWDGYYIVQGSERVAYSRW